MVSQLFHVPTSNTYLDSSELLPDSPHQSRNRLLHTPIPFLLRVLSIKQVDFASAGEEGKAADGAFARSDLPYIPLRLSGGLVAVRRAFPHRGPG
jgi:hypothetical protein